MTPSVVLSGHPFFLSLEGGEGAGKSTQAKALAQRIESRGREVVCTREPGGTEFGEAARSLVLHRSIDGGNPIRVGYTAELLLFAASRAQLVEEVIRPTLEAGAVVICDRFSHSSVAYQGYGRGVSIDVISQVNAIATGGLLPDLTVLLDVPVDVGLERRLGRLFADTFEQETLAFHERVRNGFRALAEGNPSQWLVVDATLPPEAITDLIWSNVQDRLRRVATGQSVFQTRHHRAS